MALLLASFRRAMIVVVSFLRLMCAHENVRDSKLGLDSLRHSVGDIRLIFRLHRIAPYPWSVPIMKLHTGVKFSYVIYP